MPSSAGTCRFVSVCRLVDQVVQLISTKITSTVKQDLSEWSFISLFALSASVENYFSIIRQKTSNNHLKAIYPTTGSHLVTPRSVALQMPTSITTVVHLYAMFCCGEEFPIQLRRLRRYIKNFLMLDTDGNLF